MNRSTARWTTAFAAAALITLPAGARAQTPPATAQQPPAATATSDQKSAAPEHLRQASAALNDIPAASLTGRTKTRITELKRHISALEKASPAKSASGTPKWSTDVAAADKILNELLGPGGPAPTGTTGTKAPEPAQLDETTRAKLMDVRKHLTAFAAAMSGAPEPSPAAPKDPPMASTMTTQPPATATQPPATSTQPPATAAQPPATQQPETQQPATQPDMQVAKQHLTAARDSLAQLTQLPQAAQLTGDARTQVSQLISNFNSLITAKESWGEEYKKVDANLTALIGAQTTDESSTPTSSTAGAVGTSGTVALDPAIRAKLVELRTHLNAFNKAAGGGAPAVSGTPDPAAAAANPPATAANPAAAGTQPTSPETPAADPADALKHLQAIEAILGTQAGANAGITLDRTQMEQLRTHIAELRRILGQK